MLGRDLKPDEEVDHRDRDRRNFHFSNLVIRGHYDHGWVSARQAYYMRHRDAKEKAEWDEFMAEQDAEQAQQIRAAKASGGEWRVKDGELERQWEARCKTNSD